MYWNSDGTDLGWNICLSKLWYTQLHWPFLLSKGKVSDHLINDKLSWLVGNGKLAIVKRVVAKKLNYWLKFWKWGSTRIAVLLGFLFTKQWSKKWKEVTWKSAQICFIIMSLILRLVRYTYKYFQLDERIFYQTIVSV